MKKKLNRGAHQPLIDVPKIYRIMKLLCLFMMIMLVQVSASTYSQNTKLSVSGANISLEEVFGKIEDQSDFSFFYNLNQLNTSKKVKIDLKDQPIEDILNNVLEGTGLSYTINNKLIVIHGKGENQGAKMIGQQKVTIKGKVTDSSGQPLPGVAAVIKGTNSGTITDFDGNYTLANVPDNATLVFSFVGMKTQEVPVAGKTSISVKMQEETIGIEEVVAVGYGTQKKVNMTGSVSSVNFADQVSSRPMTNVSSALSGLSSGVTIRQSEGKPGEDGATIRIRGLGTLNNNSPLVIIDGMEGVLDAINPNDIETISILKDAASSAIYGSKAANGVILVSTKKGNKDRMSITYSGNFSVAQPTNMLDFVSDYPTYMRLMNESARNIGSAEVFSTNTIEAWETANKNPNGLNENGIPNRVAFPNTNWNREMYQNNMVQDHNVSVTGGNEKSTFLFSGGYLDNPGLVENTGLKRYTMRTNLEVNINKWLTVGTRTYVLTQDKDLGNYDDVLNYIRQTTPGVFGRYNGKYGFPEAPEESATSNNAYVHLYRSEGANKHSRFNSTIYSKINLYKGLSWDFNFNYARRFDETNSHSNGNTGERIKFSTGEVTSPITDPSQMSTNYRTYANNSYTLENLLRYEKTLFDHHDISALAGYNENYYFEYDHSGTKKGLIDQSVSTLSSATEMIAIEGGASDYAMRSYFGRINYAYKQRYLFEANVRHDGSSRFYKDSRWGTFPSFSAGWRISEESFMQGIHWLDNLKIRASWGQLGNNASGNYDYQATYGLVDYSFGGTQIAGLRPGKIANPALMWESTTVTNFGVDGNFLNNKLTIEVDAYNKVTDGILTTPPIYMTLGLIGAPTQNTAEVTNKGIELTLGWKDKIGDLHYSVTGNFAYNQNEVTGYKGKLVRKWRTNDDGTQSYYSNLGDVSSGGSTRILEDHVINEYYLLDVYSGNQNYFNQDGAVNITGGPKDGMIRTQEDMAWLQAMVAAGYKFMPSNAIGKNRLYYGDIIYADNNGDGIYGNSYDNDFRKASSMPKISFGAQMNFRWKDFDMSMIWAGNAGYKLYWLESGYNRSNTRTGFQIGEILANDHYYFNESDPSDPTNNINATYPRLKLNEGDPQNVQSSTRWLYDASYLKLKNLSVGYTLPKNLASKLSIDRIRVYFSAENLLTITSFPGLDPEMGANTNYPIMRQISLGTNITF